MRSRALYLAMVLLAAFVFGQASARASATNPPWGFHDFIWTPQFWYPTSPLTTDAVVQASAADGATIDRLIVGWAWVEPNPPSGGIHDYHWSSVDRQYQAMAARNIRPLVTAYAAPQGWAADLSGGTCNGCAYRPASDKYDAWQTFLQALMQHLKSLDAQYPGFQGAYGLEVWNEPNEEFFFYPSPDAGAFVGLLKRARSAATATGFTKPIVSGGLAPITSTVQGQRIATDTYLTQMYKRRFQSYVGGIGIHPYPKGSTQLAADMNTASHYGVDTLDSIRQQRNDTHPFWITEVGVSSVPCTTTDCSAANDPRAGVNGATAQGNTLVEMYNSLATRPVSAFIIFNFEDTYPPTTTFAGYGVVDTSGGSIVPKQSYCILGTQIGNGNPGYGC